jgi:hypothetical protein
MARISTGQNYGPTGRKTSQRLLGGGDMPSIGGEIARGQMAPAAIQPQASPVNTMVNVGQGPQLGGPVAVPRPPDVPAPNGDMAALARSLGSFNQALGVVGESYVEYQKQQEGAAKLRGEAAAAQLSRFGAFKDYGEALRAVEKRAETDPSVVPLLTELRALDPRALPYAQENIQDALAKTRISSLQSDVENTINLPDGRSLESVSPDDPAFFELVTSRAMPAGLMPSVYAKNKDAYYASFGAARSAQAKRYAVYKDEQIKVGFSQGVSGDLAQLYAGQISSDDLGARLTGRLNELYANSSPSVYRDMRDKLPKSLAEAAVAAAGGDLQALDRMGPILGDALEKVLAGPNGGTPLIDQYGKPRQAVINDFYRELTQGLSTDRELQDKIESARGEDAADNDIQQYLPPEVLNNPAELQARLDALPQRAVLLFPNDPEAQLAYQNRVQTFATNRSRAYIAPIQRDNAAMEYANQAMNPSSDPTADIQRYTQMFQSRLIDESDYKGLVAGARSRNEKRNDRNYETLRGLQRDLQSQLTEQFKLTTEGDGTPAVTPQEAVQIRKTMGELYREGEKLILQNPGANLDQQLGGLYENLTMPAIDRGQRKAQQPLYQSPEAISGMFGPGRGDAADNAKRRRQAETAPMYPLGRMEKQLDDVLTGKPLDDATKKILQRIDMKPSEFFIRQMQLQGVPLDPEVQQQLRKLDGSDQVSSALPMGGGSGGMGMIMPGRTASMAQRLWKQWSTAMNSAVAPPAQARGSSPFTASASVPVGRGSRQQAIKQAAGQLGISPVHLAAVMSLETGGTFNPGIVGGQGGNYRGLIQFGPNERKTYGYRDGMRFEDQVLGPVVRYLKARGVKPGHGAQEIYAAILTGNVANIAKGGLDWKDSFGTSVRKALPSLTQGGHYQNAVRFLRGT